MRILITDTHELSGLGAVRSLGRAGHVVTAGYPNSSLAPPAVSSRWCVQSIVYPDPWRQQFLFREWLKEQLKSAAFDVILPVSEGALFAMAAIRDQIPRSVTVILPSDSALRYTLSKFHATSLAIQAGLNVPATVFISDGCSEYQWNDGLSALRFPIIFRTDNFLRDDGCYCKGSSLVAENEEEADSILREYGNISTSIFAQEVVAGVGVGAFQLHWGGQLLLDFAHRRIHEVPWTGGASSLRCSISDHQLSSHASCLLRAIPYQGVAMVEFLRSKKDGKDYFVEINGRLWGSIALALHAGIDFPAALFDCYVFGRPANDHANQIYSPGLICRNTVPGEIYYTISVLKAKRGTGVLNPPGKLATIVEFFLLSLNPRVKRDFLWLSDPVPWLVNLKITIQDLGTRFLRKARNVVNEWRKGIVLKQEIARQRGCLTQKSLFPSGGEDVLFLCYGNICRSAFAELYWQVLLKKKNRSVTSCKSAGFHSHTGRSIPDRFHGIIRSYNIDPHQHRSRLVTLGMVEWADVIFVMDLENLQDFKKSFPNMLHKVFLLGLFSEASNLEIKDPYTLSPFEATLVYQELAASLECVWEEYDRSAV